MSDQQKEQQRKKTIHRVEKTKDYSVICNHGPHDPELSWGAKGLLTYMLTMPDDWSFYDDELVKHTREGLTTTKKYVKELKRAGYIKRVPVRDPETHQFTKWETVLYERPMIPDEDQEQDDPEDQKPEGGNATTGENIENTPEVKKPLTGDPVGVESHSMEIQQLLNTNSIQNTDEQNIPIRGDKLPDMQKATAIFFTKIGGKPQLSDDDVTCLNMLFKIHTPAAIQKQILKAFERMKKSGSVKVEFEGKEYVISDPSKLPIRYIYNSMKNWSSLRNTGGKKGGQSGAKSRGNPERENKNYEKGAGQGFFI